jgi:hypothetical protein
MLLTTLVTSSLNSTAPGYTATDLNQIQGTQTAEQAAKIITKYVLGNGVGTVEYLKEDGENAW